jgi:lysophospholipase L1-like esterase
MTTSGKPGPAEIAYSWLMLPAYLWQGYGVRRRTTRMTPPQNIGNYSLAGEGKPLHLLVIGDSSAAGTGVTTIEQSFAGFLPRFLNEISGRPVRTRVVGMNSATAVHIRDFAIPHVEPRSFDYVALNVGTNDAKNFHAAPGFYREFGSLLYALGTRFPGATVVWSGVLDLETVPALPSPLNRILGIRSRLIDHTGRVLCRERGAVAPPPEWRPVPENFSADGFHASEAGYREWALAIANFILRLEDGVADPTGATSSADG